MARIRTIKPDYWSSLQVVECSFPARLLFPGLWNFCDDNGVFPALPKALKVKLFPGDAVSEELIAVWVTELLSQGLLIEFLANDGAWYWKVTGWEHQRIDKPSEKYPDIDDASWTEAHGSSPREDLMTKVMAQCQSGEALDLDAFYEAIGFQREALLALLGMGSSIQQRLFYEHSDTVLRTLLERSDCKVKESKVKEGNGEEEARTRLNGANTPSSSTDPAFEKIKMHKDWKPSNNAVGELRELGYGDKLIKSKLAEFRDFWISKDVAQTATKWDDVFKTRVQSKASNGNSKSAVEQFVNNGK